MINNVLSDCNRLVMSLKVPAFSDRFLRNQSDNKSISYVSLQLIKEIFNDLFSFRTVKRE